MSLIRWNILFRTPSECEGKNPQPAFHLTFSCGLTPHITVQLIKWICFLSSALTPIFQGAEIRSTVTEECLPNKNWCITSWKAGWRWALSCQHVPDLTFTLRNPIWFTSYVSLFYSAKSWEGPPGYHEPQSQVFHLICIPLVFVILFQSAGTMKESSLIIFRVYLPLSHLLFLVLVSTFLFFLFYPVVGGGR